MLTEKCFPSGLANLKMEFMDNADAYMPPSKCINEYKYNVFLKKYEGSAKKDKLLMAYSLTKNEMEELIEFLPTYLLKNTAKEFIDILLARYRRYMKNIVTSVNTREYIITDAQKSSLGLIEYFAVHYFHKGCLITQDCMSVFYLFCNDKDYYEIGDLRLSSVIGRFSERSQLRILKNICRF